MRHTPLLAQGNSLTMQHTPLLVQGTAGSTVEVMNSSATNAQPVIQPPLAVRVVGSVLLGLAVATMAMPLSNGIKVILFILPSAEQ